MAEHACRAQGKRPVAWTAVVMEQPSLVVVWCVKYESRKSSFMRFWNGESQGGSGNCGRCAGRGPSGYVAVATY